MYINPLPLTLKPKPGEPLLGFIQRLAEENYPPRVSMLLEEAGLSSRFSAKRRADLTGFQMLSGVFTDQLEAMSYAHDVQARTNHFFGAVIWEELVTTNSRRICPKCIVETGYHHAFWDLSVINVCPVHGTKLLRRCKNRMCNTPLSFTYGGAAECGCKSDFRKMTDMARVESPAVAYIWKRLRGEAVEGPSALKRLDFGQVMSVLYHLGWFMGGKSSSPHPAKALEERKDPTPIINRGYAALMPWPYSFHSHLKAAVARREEARGMSADPLFDAIARWIEGAQMPTVLRESFRVELRKFTVAGA